MVATDLMLSIMYVAMTTYSYLNWALQCAMRTEGVYEMSICKQSDAVHAFAALTEKIMECGLSTTI